MKKLSQSGFGGGFGGHGGKTFQYNSLWRCVMCWLWFALSGGFGGGRGFGIWSNNHFFNSIVKFKNSNVTICFQGGGYGGFGGGRGFGKKWKILILSCAKLFTFEGGGHGGFGGGFGGGHGGRGFGGGNLWNPIK